jgi:hypothetical protein
MRIVDNSTVEVTLSYDEPAFDQDNTPLISTDNPPLTDLAYTSMFYKVGTGAAVAAGKNTASKPSGGGHISSLLLVPAPVNQKTAFDFWVTSTDLTGNSAGETHASFTVDRMAPAVPINFTVA